MKIKKILSVLAAVSILSTCGTTIAMAEENADTAAAAASESAVTPITADLVREHGQAALWDMTEKAAW